jgi:hypothetical protein
MYLVLVLKPKIVQLNDKDYDEGTPFLQVMCNFSIGHERYYAGKLNFLVPTGSGNVLRSL